MGLPRDVLRWVLSLNLSVAVRNPRRDFANGYLVAEILAKYQIGELSLHSFTNSTSTEEKRSNWSLIQKCLRGQGVNLTNDTIDAIILQDQSSVERFLQNLFSFVTSQGDESDHSSPPTPLPSAGARLQSQDVGGHSLGLSEQARLEAVSSQYTMDNLQHLMQQQLALFAPERQQGIIASVIAQRSIFVQKLMEGQAPQDAMSAALVDARCQLPSDDSAAAQLAAQLGQQMMLQEHSARPGHSEHHLAPIDTEQYHYKQQHYPAAIVQEPGRSAPHRQPQGLGNSPNQRAAAPFSVPEAKNMSHSPTHGFRSIRNSGTETSARHTMNAWRNDVNNPKTESYRYWDLGSLGPESNEELMAKKLAAQKAREYGIRVGELVKANCRPRQPPKKEMSKQERAKQFAKTVPTPTKRADAKSAAQPAVQSAEVAEASPKSGPGPAGGAVPRRDSVSSMMTRHDTNTKSIADIKAEIRGWEQEDQETAADVPKVLSHTRRKSPTGRAQKQKPARAPPAPNPAPHPENAQESQAIPAQPVSSQPPQVEKESRSRTPLVADQPEEIGDIPAESDMPMPHESAVEAA